MSDSNVIMDTSFKCGSLTSSTSENCQIFTIPDKNVKQGISKDTMNIHGHHENLWTSVGRRKSLENCNYNNNFSKKKCRRLSLMELPRAFEFRRISLIECLTSAHSNSDSSVEIDTSTPSCDWQAIPHSDVSCAGPYQSCPLDHVHTRQHSPGFMSIFYSARPVWRAIALGQLLSLLLCTMAACSHFLYNKYNVVIPTGQGFLHYVLLCLVYTTWLACRSGELGLVTVLRYRGWHYMLLALADVEANYLLITAHQFTTLTSIQLLDCVSIPTVLALSCIILKVRYKMVHIVGVCVCLVGVGCLVWADIEEGKPLGGGKNRLLGDMLCLGGAALLATVTVAEEFVVKTLDWVEYLGMLGLFGSLISGLQLWLLEWPILLTLKWDYAEMPMALLAGFGLTQFIFKSIVPVVLKDSGATAMQLSLLTTDFYALLLGILLLEYKFHALYFLSFTLTVTGVLIYAIKRTPIASQQPANYSEVCVSIPSVDTSEKEESSQETTPLLHSTWS